MGGSGGLGSGVWMPSASAGMALGGVGGGGWCDDSGTPLIGHGAGDAGIGLGSLLPTGGAGTEFVLPAGGLIGPPTGRRQREDVGRDEERKILQPQTSALARVITELPRLYHLGWFAYTRVDSANRIFYSYTGDAAI